MKISVITATFNSANTVESTIQSVLAQTHGDVEYIVVDGGSRDSTLDIIQKYRSRISQIISEPDEGIYDALNKGIAAASGDFVGFMHSDDMFAHDNVLSAVAREGVGFDAVYGDLNYVASKSTESVIRKWRSKEFKPSLLRSGWMPPHPALYVRKAIYERAGAFDLSFNIAADYESVLRYFSLPGFRAAYVNDTFVRMRLGGASNGSIKGIVRKSMEDWRALRMHKVGFPPLVLLRKNMNKIPQFFHLVAGH